MSKMMLNILTVTLATLMMSGCVKDESTMGDGEVVNDNTFAPMAVRAAMDEQQKKVVDFFHTGANQATGMTCNSSTDNSTLTTGASGMGVMNLVVGVERGWITREAAAAQIVKIVRFLKTADRFAGSWAHWYKPDGKITPFGDQVKAGEVVETAFMMGGLLTACEYFTGSNSDETEIRTTTQEFWETIDWRNFVKNDTFYWIWHEDENRHELPLVGWNETLLVYILAMAAPEPHNVPQSVYTSCWQGYNFSDPGRKTYGYLMPLGSASGGPLFLSQYSFLGLDPRLMEDDYVYYWTQNQSHTMINRHYCVYEAPAEYKYTVADWGLTACGGCGSIPDYKQRGPDDDDGIIAPTAAISAFPFTPFYSTQVLLNLRKNYPGLSAKYGFQISYSPKDKAVGNGYLGMEHAPMGIMMENYRSGLIWNLLMSNEHVQRGLELAGMKATPDYTPGFYTAVINTQTGVYDMMRHPDREKYEIDLFAKTAGKGTLALFNAAGTEVFSAEVNLTAGTNVVSFFDSNVLRSKKYTLRVTDAGGQSYSIAVCLR